MIREDPFEALLHRYRGLLFSLCHRFCRRGTTADDLLQDASVALFKVSDRLLAMPTGMQQAALVWKISRNAMIDTLRRLHDEEPVYEGMDVEADDHHEVEELRERVALLDEPDRTLVQMQLEGYRYDEIAEATGLSEKNVSVRLVRVKEKLRKSYI